LQVTANTVSTASVFGSSKKYASAAGEMVAQKTIRASIRRAGNLAQQFGLRGYDSVQLAAAELTQTVLRAPVTFASFDNNLNDAARTNGLNLLAIR
jgi:hypothetical protein